MLLSKNREIYRFLCSPQVLITMVPRNGSFRDMPPVRSTINGPCTVPGILVLMRAKIFAPFDVNRYADGTIRESVARSQPAMTMRPEATGRTLP